MAPPPGFGTDAELNERTFPVPTIDIGITRSRDNRRIFGVCGGIAEKYGFNPMATRIGTVILAVVIPGITVFPVILAYVALGLLLPEDDSMIDLR